MNKNSLRVLFALQVVGQPRNSKRISMLQKAGFQVEAIAFERKYHKGRLPSCPVKMIWIFKSRSLSEADNKNNGGYSISQTRY